MGEQKNTDVQMFSRFDREMLEDSLEAVKKFRDEILLLADRARTLAILHTTVCEQLIETAAVLEAVAHDEVEHGAIWRLDCGLADGVLSCD